MSANKISYTLYNDYIKAVKYLNLSLGDTKNIYPNDFNTMHDLRTYEYASLFAKKQKKERNKLSKDISNVANKYQGLSYRGKYIVVLARNLTDFKVESEVLSHCVAKMGYDKKMANEDSLIAFVREIDRPTKPFFTLEFSPKTCKILQLYGAHNCSPSKEVSEFVNKEWLKHAKQQLKKVA